MHSRADQLLKDIAGDAVYNETWQTTFKLFEQLRINVDDQGIDLDTDLLDFYSDKSAMNREGSYGIVTTDSYETRNPCKAVAAVKQYSQMSFPVAKSEFNCLLGLQIPIHNYSH